MSNTQHYRLDPSAASVVVICELCQWRGLGIDRSDATAQVRRHLISGHPLTSASRSAQRQLQRSA
jgi:hypothetical protein